MVRSKTELQGRFIENLFGCVVCLYVMFLLSEDDVEDGVRAAACLIHVGCSHSPTNKKKRNMIISTVVIDVFTDPYSFICLLSAAHSRIAPKSLRWATWLCFQSPSDPGCHCRKWRLAWTDLQHKAPSEDAPWPADSLCSWDSAGHAHAHSRSPCNSPFKDTCKHMFMGYYY